MKNILLLFVITLGISCFKKEESDINITSDTDSISGVDTGTAIFPENYLADTANIEVASVAETILTYDDASRLNTVEGWRQFLKDNPGYEDISQIEENIIRAEVAEIRSDENTGEMPESEQVSSTSRAVSTIEVENDTSCELILRYSGPDAKKIAIAPNSKSKISLSSGNYHVAASACGYNYAGAENLNGGYTVVYYISTVSY